MHRVYLPSISQMTFESTIIASSNMFVYCSNCSFALLFLMLLSLLSFTASRTLAFTTSITQDGLLCFPSALEFLLRTEM